MSTIWRYLLFVVSRKLRVRIDTSTFVSYMYMYIMYMYTYTYVLPYTSTGAPEHRSTGVRAHTYILRSLYSRITYDIISLLRASAYLRLGARDRRLISLHPGEARIRRPNSRPAFNDCAEAKIYRHRRDTCARIVRRVGLRTYTYA